MILKGKILYAPLPRINLWAKAGAGLFGNFFARYQWSAEVGCRYFTMRKMNFKKKNDGL